jgi:hypothetical protein
MDSIANPQLNNDPGTIIAFPDETSGLGALRSDRGKESSENELFPTELLEMQRL